MSQESLIRFASYLEIGFSLALATLAFRYWFFPQPEQLADIYYFSALLGFEFIMVHSAVFMVIFPARVSLFIFFPLYGLFAWAFSQIGGGDILWMYLLVVLNRMRFAFFNKDYAAKMVLFKASFIRAFIYIGSLALVMGLLSNVVPVGGFTPSFWVAAKQLHYSVDGGYFLAGPAVAMCFGMVYFLCLVVFDYWVMHNNHRLEAAI